ncbi:MAG: YybS family protein [Syntrophomonadaceae bacterium]|nr:YybS family protein [Syntrophomonadaceae bacterium]
MARNQVSYMVEGALMAALTAVLALIGLLVPPLMLITSLIWTIPIVVLIVRRDFKTGVMATIVAAFLVTLVVGPVRAFFLILQFGGLGLVYGYLFKVRVSSGNALLGGALVAAASTALATGLSFLIMGGSFANLEAASRETANAMIEAYRKAGVLENMTQGEMTPEELADAMVKMMTVLLPGALVIGGVFSAFINFILSRAVVKRLGLYSPYLPPFRRWQLPWYMVWGFIAGLGFWLLGDYLAIRWLAVAGQNILYVFLPILFVIGLSVATYFYHRWTWPVFFKVMALVIAVLYLPMAIMTLMMMGLLDTLFNYRKITGDEEEGKPA